MKGVKASSDVRSDKALVAGEETDVTGIDPATIGSFYRFEWTQGSDKTLAQLGKDGAVVTKDYAEDNHLAVGGKLAIHRRPATRPPPSCGGSTTRRRPSTCCTT